MTGCWQTKSIGEVFRIVNGGTPKTDVQAFWGGEHQWITPAEMGGLESPYLAASRRTLTDAGLQAAELVPANSIILSSRAPIGHLVINKVPMAFNQGCKGLVPADGMDTKFAYYFVMASVPLLESLGTGATFKELSGGKLKEVPIRFPAISEQLRIAGILDEAFAGITTVKTHSKNNLKNSQDALNTAKQEIFGSLASRYEIEHLGLVCDFENGDRGKNYPGKQHRVSHGVPFINAGHLSENGIEFANMDYISTERFNLLGNGKVRQGDVLFCLRGSLGKFARVDDPKKGAIASSLVILRPTPKLDTDFLLAFLSSQQCAAQIDLLKGGAAQPNLGAKDLKRFELPLPPVGVQREVANGILELQDRTRSLESIYKRKLAALDELKQSLLHQAFSGQL